MFLQDSPKDWAFQVHKYANAQNSQLLSELNVSPREIVFHTQPRIPLTFDLNLNRNTLKICNSKNCCQLPQRSHNFKTDSLLLQNSCSEKRYVTNLLYSI